MKTTFTKAEELAWAYLLLNGTVVESRSYYGNTTNYKLAYEAAEGILEAGIDFDQTTKVHDEHSSRFNGTFNEESATVKEMVGNLVLNNGKEYEFAQDDMGADVFEILAEMVGIDSIQAAAKKLLKDG